MRCWSRSIFANEKTRYLCLLKSLSFCSFTECSNLSTWARDFWELAYGSGGPREWIPVEMVGRPGGQDSSMKISANFIHFVPLKKLKFSSVWHGPLSRWLPFEHSGTKMDILEIDPVYSTLCPSITATHSKSKFHFYMFQYSVGGAIMIDSSTYGQDCTVGKGFSMEFGPTAHLTRSNNKFIF